MTRGAIIREYFRLVDLVNQAEQDDLLDSDHAQELRLRYSDRAEVVLSHLRKEARKSERVKVA